MGDVIRMKDESGEDQLIGLVEFTKMFAGRAIKNGHVSIEDGNVGISQDALVTFGSILGMAIEQEEALAVMNQYPRVFTACCLVWLGAVSKLPGSGEFLTDLVSKSCLSTKTH